MAPQCKNCGRICVWVHREPGSYPGMYDPVGGVQLQLMQEQKKREGVIDNLWDGTNSWRASGVRHDTTCPLPRPSWRGWVCFVCKLKEGKNIFEFKIWEIPCKDHGYLRDAKFIPEQGPYKGKELTVDYAWMERFKAEKEDELKKAQKKLQGILSTQAVNETLDGL